MQARFELTLLFYVFAFDFSALNIHVFLHRSDGRFGMELQLFLEVSFVAKVLSVISIQSMSWIFSFLYKSISALQILHELLK